MSDELVGDNATLVWDGLSSVQLRYRAGWLKHKSTHTAQLLNALGERTIPVEALSDVELVLPGAGDPVMAVAGKAIHRLFDPYRFYYEAKLRLHLAGDTTAPAEPTDDPRVVQLGAGGDAPGLLFAAALRARIA